MKEDFFFSAGPTSTAKNFFFSKLCLIRDLQSTEFRKVLTKHPLGEKKQAKIEFISKRRKQEIVLPLSTFNQNPLFSLHTGMGVSMVSKSKSDFKSVFQKQQQTNNLKVPSLQKCPTDLPEHKKDPKQEQQQPEGRSRLHRGIH